MYIPDFKYYKPQSTDRVSQILLENDNSAVIAGGTDLLVELKSGLRLVTNLISLTDIPELRYITDDSDYVYIGSGVTHNDLVRSKIIRKHLPALSEAASKIGSHQIRNMGTVGGNLCTGASCADTAPILMAYEAKVELVSCEKVRPLPLSKFFIFHHKTELQRGEILNRIIVPKKKVIRSSCFEKFGLREASSISVASAAAVLEFQDGVCSKANIVIGACSPTPIMSEKAGKVILGKSLKELKKELEILKLAGNAASNDSIPIDDIRGSADYRRQLVKVLTKNALSNAIIRVTNHD